MEYGEGTDSSQSYWWQTMKRCPKCKHRLMTRTDGKLYCTNCGYMKGINFVPKVFKKGITNLNEPGWYV